MANTKAPHHSGTHQRRAAKICAAAYADPATRCWRCHRTLHQIRTLKPRARWTAGHLPGYDGQADAPMAAECSPCNFSHGATLGNQRRAAITRARALRTPLTW